MYCDISGTGYSPLMYRFYSRRLGMIEYYRPNRLGAWQ